MPEVVHQVPLIAQCNTLTCWYAAAMMVIRWNRGHGNRYIGLGWMGDEVRDQVCDTNTYVNVANPHAVAEFARLAHMRTTCRTTTPDTLADLLTAHGPLWYGGRVNGYRGFRSGAHAIVIRGITGNTVLINDPAPQGAGARLRMDHDLLFSELQHDPTIPFLHG